MAMVGTSKLALFAFIFTFLGCVQTEKLANVNRQAEAPAVENNNGGGGGGGTEEAEDDSGLGLKDKALAILEQHCANCHNLNDPQGGFGTVLDVGEMIKSGRYLIPGNPEASELITRLAPRSNMPPVGPISEEEQKILADWITNIEVTVVEPLDEFQQMTLIRNDLDQFLAAQRRNIRYFTLQVPNNAGLSDQTKEFMIKALGKTLNSFSKASIVTIPTAIDERKLIYRIDLQNLGINPVVFDTVMDNFYPFSATYEVVGNSPNEQRLVQDHDFAVQETQTNHFLIRMDWFNATASLPILYKGLLELPDTQPLLEQQLGVDLVNNINSDLVLRAGFRNSGVSSQNRVLERHVSNANLAYWVSYDFADNNEGTQNIFNFPLGPVGSGFDAKAFEQDGGEVIFQLPNGLFGYYLAVGTGEEIHKGPTQIVRQPDGPLQFFQQITNGLSCFSCHGQGLLYKKDDIREFVTVSQDFSNAEKNKILNMYVDNEQYKAVIDQDNKFYFDALLKLGIREGDPDPVNQAFRYYNKNLFRGDILAELGVTDTTLNLILNTEPFKSAWVSIYNNAGSITRQEFNLLYPQAVNIFKNGEIPVLPLLGDHLATPDCMAAIALFMDECTTPLSLDAVVVQ